MREIKFRYYNAASRTMHPNVYYAVDLDGNFLMSMPLDDRKYPEGDRRFTVTELHPGDALDQFTGLKDKNGVEIYEGDIVKFDDLDVDVRVGRNESTIFKAAPVEWSDFEMRFGARTYKGLQQFYRDYTEVIGNLYENPKLLKDK